MNEGGHLNLERFDRYMKELAKVRHKIINMIKDFCLYILCLHVKLRHNIFT